VTAGSLSGSGTIDDVTLTSEGGLDLLVTVHDEDGAPAFAATFGASGAASDESAASLAVDGDGNILVCGGFSTPFSLGGDDLANSGALDVFLAKLTPGGGHLWSRRFGFAEDQAGVALGVDGGNVFMAGDFAGAINFFDDQQAQMVSEGSSDVFVASFQP
jgi:hypothetical protein